MKALKLIFVWILLLALPLQGFAAVSLSMCDSGPMTVASASGEHHGGAGASDAMACDHHGGQQPADEASPGGMAKCSTCAACPVGAAIVTAFAPVAQFNSHGAERIPYVGAYDTDCIYGALERPPHTFS